MSTTGSTVNFRTTVASDALTSAIFTGEKLKETACGKNGAMASHKLLICQWLEALKSLISGAERNLDACYPSQHILRVPRLTIYDLAHEIYKTEGKSSSAVLSTEASDFLSHAAWWFKSESFREFYPERVEEFELIAVELKR